MQLASAWHRRNAVALVLAVISAATFGIAQARQADALGTDRVPMFEVLDSVVQDFALRTRTPDSYLQASAGQLTRLPDPTSFITIVGIDERTLAELGAYNGGYPRSYHAQVVKQILAGSPRVIAYDVGFFEPTGDDSELEAAFEQARTQRVPTRIVLAAAGVLPNGQAALSPDGELTFDRDLEPLPGLAAGADVAVTNVLPDSLGTIRSMPLLARLGGVERPTLGLAAAAAYLRRPAPLDDAPTADSVQVGGRTVPVDAAKRVKINYFGAPSEAYGAASTFRVVSFVDVLRGRIDPALWRNGLVFVGALGATGLADDYWTPMSQPGGRKMAGVEIHANVASTIFSGQFLRDAPVSTQLALIFGMALIIALLMANLGALGGIGVSVSAAVAFIAASFWLIHAWGLLLPVTSTVLAGAFPLVGMLAYRVTVEQRKSRGLLSALASVIPPAVAREIARDPERVGLGGERRSITVLFADLKGFTSFSESVEPEIVHRVITDFLEAMTQVVFRHGGTVDKFIGDAVMALWNAPLDDPEHARHACEAALEMQLALRALSDRWEKAGLPRQAMRIGINTGPASVGNMGTRQRFAYTALGDTVNLGARLEPLNGVYGSSICISRATLDASGGYDRFLMRFLDLVEIKGKRDPVPIYELMGRLDDAGLAARFLPILEPYRKAVALYQASDFEAAGRLFRIALNANPDSLDQPSRLFAERCAEYLESPPGPGWDGVFRRRLGRAA